MKKYIIIASLFALASCDDLLEEHPKAISSANFYSTKEEVQGGLNAIYVPFGSNSAMGGLYPAQQEAYADYGFGRGSYTLVSQFQGLDDANIVRTDNMWVQFYRSIRNANILLSRVPLSTHLDEHEVKVALAEAKFMRALVYSILVKNWGSVPLRTETNMDIVDIPKASLEEIWSLIESDLQYAIQELPLQPRRLGTPSKGSAKTALIDCLMYTGNYEEARRLADEVINSNQYKLVEISNADDFMKLYGPEASGSSEEIFYIKYTREGNSGWQFPMFPHHPAAGYLNGSGYFALHSDSENKVIKSWDNADFRKEFNWYSWDIGIGPTTILNRKYRDVSAPNGGSIGVDYPLYRYAEVLLWFAEADFRTNSQVTTAALDALNQVRRRAYGFPSGAASAVDFKMADFQSPDQFLDTVIRERGYETCYEGKRWLDLKRLGIAAETIKEVYNYDIAERHYLWPIALSEMNYNKALNPTADQNPGY